MRKSFKQIAAATLSAAMVMAPSLSVLATAPTQNAGTGNILAYSLESVIVPTDFKVALNPQGLTVTTDAAASPKVTTQEQIVTFTYGVGNLSTSDMVVSLTLTVSSEEASGITFAASADEVDAAAAGDLTMYLALVPSTGEVKTKANASFAVTPKDGANESNVTAANMVEVKMTNDTENAVVFAAGTGNAVVAEKSFELEKCTYDVMDGQTVDFTTTQTALAEKMEITALADEGASIGGFTIIGAMNENADWTTANVDALSFAPVYEVQTALAAAAEAAVTNGANSFKTTHSAVLALTTDTVEGTEEELAAINAAITAFNALSAEVKTELASGTPAVTADTLAALKEASEAAATPAEPSLSATTVSASSPSVTVTLTEGVTVSSLVLTKAAGGTVNLTTPTHYSVSGTTYTFTSTFLGNQVGGTITFTFSDNSTKTVTIQ